MAERLFDKKNVAAFESELRSLELTGMGTATLESFLKAGLSQEREWESGEALAEAFLEECYEVVFPWNMRRDKRTPQASLPGADLLGLVWENGQSQFVLGEVKTSSEAQAPPQVMYGRNGMTQQLERLSSRKDIQYQVILWFWERTKTSEFAERFRKATVAFFNSAGTVIQLIGVLVRDTAPNPLDLSGRGQALRKILDAHTRCLLIGLYLPIPLDDLARRIARGPS